MVIASVNQESSFRFKRREMLLLLVIALLTLVGYSYSTAPPVAWSVLAVLSGVNVYLAYRFLFRQRYVGVVASLFLVLSPYLLRYDISFGTLPLNVFLSTAAFAMWMARSWVVWGVSFGLAVALDARAVALLLPFAGEAWFDQRILTRRILVGAVAAAAVLAIVLSLRPIFVAAWWTLDAGWLDSSVGPNLAKMPLQLAYLIAYVVVASLVLRIFDEQVKAIRVLSPILLVAVPHAVVFFANWQSLVAAGGTALILFSLIALTALWFAEERRASLYILALWMALPLFAFPSLGLTAKKDYVVALPALALLACRLLDRSLSGQWLDLWWMLGLSSSWYYRFVKVLTLALLGFSFYQSAMS